MLLQDIPFERSTLRSNSSLVIKYMVAEGGWLAFMNMNAVRRELQEGQMRELVIDGAARPLLNKVGIIYRKGAPLSTASQALIAEIRAAQARRQANE